MKYFNQKTIAFVLFFTASCAILLSFGCQGKNESAPFFDGLYLKYSEVFGDLQKPENIVWTREIEYKFKKLENEHFHIIQKVKTQKGEKLDKQIKPTPYPQVGDDLTIDRKGIVLKGGDGFMNFINGYASYLWLPSDMRKKGFEVIEIILKVGEKTKWQGWEVITVKGMLGDMHYYDVNTGILVGTEKLKGRLKMILMDTNLDALKASISTNLDQ